MRSRSKDCLRNPSLATADGTQHFTTEAQCREGKSPQLSLCYLQLYLVPCDAASKSYLAVIKPQKIKFMLHVTSSSFDNVKENPG